MTPLGAGGAAAAAAVPSGPTFLLPWPRQNGVLAVAPHARMDYVKNEIAKFDQPSAPAAQPTAFPLKKASAAPMKSMLAIATPACEGSMATTVS